MRLPGLTLLVGAASLVSAGESAAQERTGAAACAPPIEETVAFSAPDAAERVRISIMSDDCANGAWMEIEIFSADDETLYLDGWPQSNFYDWSRETLIPAEEALAMAAPMVGAMPDYPSAAEIAADPDLIEGDFYVIAPAETFDRAREAGGAVVCYLTSPVEAACAWFDPQTGQAVKLYGYAG